MEGRRLSHSPTGIHLAHQFSLFSYEETRKNSIGVTKAWHPLSLDVHAETESVKPNSSRRRWEELNSADLAAFEDSTESFQSFHFSLLGFGMAAHCSVRLSKQSIPEEKCASRVY